MAHPIHELTVKQIISRVRQVFPDAPETYIMSLINDAVNEIGQYSQKSVSAKIDLESGKMFYGIGDSDSDSSSAKLGVNKVYRVDILDDAGDYIRIPRVLDGEPLQFDIASESAINVPE
mgnify:FL=1